MVASLSLCSQDPSCAAGTTPVVSLALQESPDPMAMSGLSPQKGNSSPVMPSPQICQVPGLSWLQGSTAWCLWAGGGHELQNLGGSRNPTCHHSVPAATSHCPPRRPLPPWEAANGAGRCWGRFVFPSPVINPWQIREALGEQTRPGQSKNASSQPGKQFHVQDPLLQSLCHPGTAWLLQGDAQTSRRGRECGRESHAALGDPAHGDKRCGSCITSWHAVLHSQPCCRDSALSDAPGTELSPGKDPSPAGFPCHLRCPKSSPFPSPPSPTCYAHQQGIC